MLCLFKDDLFYDFIVSVLPAVWVWAILKLLFLCVSARHTLLCVSCGISAMSSSGKELFFFIILQPLPWIFRLIASVGMQDGLMCFCADHWSIPGDYQTDLLSLASELPGLCFLSRKQNIPGVSLSHTCRDDLYLTRITELFWKKRILKWIFKVDQVTVPVALNVALKATLNVWA